MLSFVHSDGAKTAYDMRGDGPAILLIHGAEGTRKSFERIAPKLADRFTVITYDQRDCGETVSDAVDVDLSLLASDAAELLRSIGRSSAYIFGTSFGGRVAQAVALLHPEIVKRLVLASTWALPLSLLELNAEVASETARLRAGLPETAEILAEYFFPPAFLTAQPQFRQHFAKAPARSSRSDRRARTVNDRPSLKAGDISVKTLLLAGECDRLVPPALTLSMKNEIRETESTVLPGVGHMSCAQAPDEVATRMLRFFG